MFICPHTGFHGDYDPPLRWGVRCCWCILGPPLRLLLGYFPASKLGFGEDLPDRIALQWAARTQPHFATGLADGNAIREQQMLDRVKRLRRPALVISTDDDDWATEPDVRRVLQVYRSLLIVRLTVGSSESYKRTLGHSGFFRRSQRKRLWPLILRFISCGHVVLEAT